MEAIGFGDTVRVRSTPVTEGLGLAGKVGHVYGETTPSVTGVEVIGGLETDFAINVTLNEENDTLWFSPDLLEFVDHTPGITIEVEGHRLVRDAQGEWHDRSAEPWPKRVLSWLFGPLRASR